MTMNITMRRLSADVIRVQAIPPGAKRDSALNEYGFLFEAALEPAPENAAGLEIIRDADSRLTAYADGVKLFALTSWSVDGGASKTIFESLDSTEDWVGFGDLVRDRIYHRGHRIECVLTDVASYLPVPFFMSTRGYGILVNTTCYVTFDMAHEDERHFGWTDRRGAVDFYVIAGADFKSIQRRYLDLTGKPVLPPLWSFGLWYICRTQADVDEVMRNATEFRDRGLPCDVIGLEPGWMEKDYDLSTQKDWSRKRFDLPDWQLHGCHHFISALKRMGFHLELWLCCEYDLGYEEERRRGRPRAEFAEMTESDLKARRKDIDIDGHLGDTRLSDGITRPEEPWFEHLKKFVDWGADFFKQDGAYQVSFHPDRYWRGCGLNDDEMHNFYPLCYSRQMSEGFENYTQRRGLVFTVGGWTGFQHYCGTWTGDTGGRLETLGAMLNTAMIGHSFCTNDMEVTEPEGIHFGYLLPWSQINSWTYFRMPWTQGSRLLAMHRRYGELRARLIPYLYSCARGACQGGDPVLMPLPLEFPGDGGCRNILHEYLLGPALLVGIYKHEMYFPAGEWSDFWTGELVSSPGETRSVEWPEEYGGALYLREGALLPLGSVMAWRGEQPLEVMELIWFPSAARPSEFEFYEDDGVSFQYRAGRFAVTRITGAASVEGELRLTIQPPEGDLNMIPDMRSWQINILLKNAPRAILLDGLTLPASEWCFDRQTGRLSIRRRIANGTLVIH